VGVDAGADGRAAEGNFGEVFAGLLYALDAALDLPRVAEELLPETNRGGVLEVRPPGLDHGVELDGFVSEGVTQLVERWQEVALDGDEGGEVDGCRDNVVGGLAAVDVVVGVDGVLGAELSAQDLHGPVGDDLVGVHVGRGPRAGLEDVQHELVVQSSLYDLLGGGDDGVPSGSRRGRRARG
jgi:hypothetical protein